MRFLRHLRQLPDEPERLKEHLAVFQKVLLRLGRAHLQNQHQFARGDGFSVNLCDHSFRRHGRGRLGPHRRRDTKH